MIRALIACVLLGLAGSASAQTRVSFTGRGPVELDERIEALLDAGNFTLVSSDTVLARDDTLRGPVLVLGTTLRIEGVIAGDLTIIDANVFVRPTGRITGDVANLGGGFYPSEQALVAGSVLYEPNAPYSVDRRDGELRIIGELSPSTFDPDGFRGLREPTYDRVRGLTLSAGGTFLPPRIGRVEPLIRAWAGYAFESGEPQGGGEIGVRRGGVELVGGAERTTLHNDHWIRSDIINSVSVLFQGKDYHDYYEADRFYGALRGEWERPRRTVRAQLRAGVEDARTLTANDPWVVFGDSVRFNRPVNDGRISSAELSLAGEWELNQVLGEIGGLVEAAGTMAGGDFEFMRYSVWGDWKLHALANHTLEFEWNVRGPLPGTDSLPRQRWTYVGGSGTLYTFEIGDFPGDRLVFVETSYIVPAPQHWRIPLLGVPRLELLHHAGMAWSHENSRDFEQNVGVRINFPFVYARVVTNPRRFSDDVEFSVGLTLPERSLPWERPRR